MNKIYSSIFLMIIIVLCCSCNKNIQEYNYRPFTFNYCSIALADTLCETSEQITSDYILLGGNLDTFNYLNKPTNESYPFLISNQDFKNMLVSCNNNNYLSLTRTLKSENIYTNIQDKHGRISKVLLPKGSKVTFLWQPIEGKQGIYYLFELLGWIDPVRYNTSINIIKFNN